MFLQTQMRTRTHGFPRQCDGTWQHHHQSTGINGESGYHVVGVTPIPYLGYKCIKTIVSEEEKTCIISICRYSTMHLLGRKYYIREALLRDNTSFSLQRSYLKFECQKHLSFFCTSPLGALLQ